MQAPALRSVKAFQKRGVHADSLSPCYHAVSYQFNPFKLQTSDGVIWVALFCRDGRTDLLWWNAKEVSLRTRFGNRRLSEGKDKDVFRLDAFLLNS